MFTKIGNKRFYDNFQMGCAKPTEVGAAEDKNHIFFVFEDKDNEEFFLFQVGVNQIDQFCNLAKQTAAGQKIEIASRMPNVPDV